MVKSTGERSTNSTFKDQSAGGFFSTTSATKFEKAEEALERKIETNRFYPFHSSKTEGKDTFFEWMGGQLVLFIRYYRYYWFVIGALLCLVFIGLQFIYTFQQVFLNFKIFKERRSFCCRMVDWWFRWRASWITKTRGDISLIIAKMNTITVLVKFTFKFLRERKSFKDQG